MASPRSIVCVFAAGFFFLAAAPSLFADFKLIDAIQEFGEKRFVQSDPARLKAGPLKIHPTLRSKVTYDDNVLLEAQDPREDVVFNIQPGAILELPVGKHQLAAGYEADFEFFSKRKNGRQKDQNQNFFVLADLHFPNAYVNVLENFAETSNRSGTTFTERIPRIDQSIHPKAGIRWQRAVFEGGFRHFVRDYRRHAEKPFDFQLVEWTGVFYYDLFTRLKTLLEYQFGQIDYPNNFTRKGNFNQVRAGFEGEIITNVSAKLRAGPQFRRYPDSSSGGFSSWVAYASVDYRVRPALTLKAGFSRQPVEAAFGNVKYYTEHLLHTGFEYKLLTSWILFSDIHYSRHGYRESSVVAGRDGFRRDHHAGVKSGLRYALHAWLEFELAYEYLRRNSNFSLFDYTDNRVSFSTLFSY